MNITTPERFWKKVAKSTDDNCWPWLRHCTRLGYGMVGYEGRKQPSHRIAYLFTFGDFDRSLDVLHKCDNPPCCNPKHLFLGTAKDNIHDAIKKGRWSPMQKEESPRHILTLEQVKEIRSTWKPGYGNAAKLARAFMVSPGCIWGIITNRNWKI
jgi:hypothetical protein